MAFNFSDKIKKIILFIAIGLFSFLVIADLVLGFAGVNVPARADAISEIVKILAAVVAIITAKLLPRRK